VSTLLCTFDILPPVDSNGKPILPDPEFASGIISYVHLRSRSINGEVMRMAETLYLSMRSSGHDQSKLSTCYARPEA
jgi:hypothetical protein